MQEVMLEILVAVCGSKGLERLAGSRRPPVAGVRYLVNVQGVAPGSELPAALVRPDMEVAFSSSMGVSRNRNELLDRAAAPLVMMSDDDLDYTPEGLRGVIEAFGRHPEADILTFRHSGDDPDRVMFPDHGFDLKDAPRHYFVTCFDIAMRRSGRTRGLRFDERFSIGTPFPQGEEDIFMADARRKRLRARYVPLTVSHHPGLTTYPRLRTTAGFIRGKGAVFARTRPWTWPLRMVAHGLRESGRDGMPPLHKYLWWWTQGALASLRMMSRQ